MREIAGKQGGQSDHTPTSVEAAYFVLFNFLLHSGAFLLAVPSLVRVVRADGGTFAEYVTTQLYVTALALLAAGVLLGTFALLRRMRGDRLAWSGIVLLESALAAGVAMELSTFLLLGLHPYGRATWAAVGTADVRNLPLWFYFAVLLTLLLIAALQFGLFHAARRLAARRAPSWLRKGPAFRALAYGAVGLGAFMLMDRPDAERLIVRAALPLYSIWSASVRDLPDPRPLVAINDTGPLPPMQRKPDIVIVMAESLRGDVFSSSDMPLLSRFAAGQSCTSAPQHFAGGHLTQYGTFALFYGLGAWAFMPYMQEGHRSWILDVLRANDYEIIALDASGVMTYSIPPLVPGQFDRFDQRLQADSALTEETMRLINEHSDRPRLIFTFLYSTHAPYLYPAQFARHETEGREWMDGVHRHYLNSVGYVDSLMTSIARAAVPGLEAGNTVLLLTGDHGEEFGEHGLYGHASVSFWDERVRVPLVACGLDIAAAAAQSPTEHADLLPSILAQSGVELPASRVTGRDLSQGGADSQVVLAGSGFPVQSGEFAIVTGSHKFWFNIGDSRFESWSLARVTDLRDVDLAGEGRLSALADSAVSVFRRSWTALLRMN